MGKPGDEREAIQRIKPNYEQVIKVEGSIKNAKFPYFFKKSTAACPYTCAPNDTKHPNDLQVTNLQTECIQDINNRPRIRTPSYDKHISHSH